MQLAAIPVNKRSAGVAPDLNLRHPLCAGKEAHKQGIHPGFETQGRCHQKSKTGVSVSSQKGPVSSKFFLKKHDPNEHSYPCTRLKTVCSV